MRTDPERMRIEPQRAGRNSWIYSDLPPPRGFIAESVHLAMVPSTQRNSELIADLAAERPTLCKAQVMGIRRRATANKRQNHGRDFIIRGASRVRRKLNGVSKYAQGDSSLRRCFASFSIFLRSSVRSLGNCPLFTCSICGCKLSTSFRSSCVSAFT